MILLVAAIITFGSGRYFSENDQFIAYFNDQVGGLDIGAPVKFKGVTIGEVQDVFIRYNQPNESDAIPVIITIYTSTLREKHNVEANLADPDELEEQIYALGLRASLQQESFVTGKLIVQLDYFPSAPPPVFVQLPSEQASDERYMEIPSISTGVTAAMKKILQMVNDISRVDFGQMGLDIARIVSRLEQDLSEFDLPGLSRRTSDLLDNINAILDDPELRAVASEVNVVLRSAREPIGKADQLLTNVNDQIDPVVADFQQTTAELRATLEAARMMIAAADASLEPGSPLQQRVMTAMDEVSLMARSLRMLADYFERNPSAFLTGRQSPEE